MVRNTAIGIVAFLAGLLASFALFLSASTPPEVAMDQSSARFDALDEALASLDRTLRREAFRAELEFRGPLQTEPAANAFALEIALMREELHGILEALEARGEILPAAGTQQDRQGSAAVYEAQQRSWDVVNGALAAERWTEEDARELFTSWTGLSPAERQALLGALFSAANRGEIQMEEADGLF